MVKVIRRYSDWLALLGLVLVLVGMLGTARQIKELSQMAVATPPEGFLPIFVEVPVSQAEARFAPQFIDALMTQGGSALEAHLTATPEIIETEVQEKAVEAAAPDLSTAGQAVPDLPSPTSIPDAIIPDWLEIPAIGLDVPIVAVDPDQVQVDGRWFEQWTAPNVMAAGWHDRSALLGSAGNLVLNGHNNIFGSVFAQLKDLQPGDQVSVYGGGRAYGFVVAQVMLLEERDASIEVRTDNARWILPSEDTRLTLVTCWPPESNTHRLIVVARPDGNP